MIFYYKTLDAKEGETWKKAEHTEYEEIKKHSAKHIGIYLMSEELQDGITVTYEGDFWIDIDHTAADCGSEEVAIERSIDSIRKLQVYLKLIHVNLQSCELFISGGKGFHLRIPLACFGGVKRSNLPLVFRGIANFLEAKTGATGIDPMMYNMKKGKLCRVEDKQRADNGRYKVRLLWSELDNLTPESYFTLASAPRGEFPLDPAVPTKELIRLFNDSVSDLAEREKSRKYEEVDSDYFTSALTGLAPCIRQLSVYEDVKSSVNSNAAKMTMARYLPISKLSDAEKDALLHDFGQNFPSDRYKTPALLEAAVRSLASWGEENAHGFSCKSTKRMFTNNPCANCPVTQKQILERTAAGRLLIANNAIFNYTKTGEVGNMIGRFSLKPLKMSYETDANGNERDLEFSFELSFYNTLLRSRTVDISTDAFLTKNSLQKALKNHVQAEWTGSDTEVAFLKTMVTDPLILEDVEKVIRVKKLGIQRVIDNSREEPIDEYVWVQNGWSLNGAGVAKTVVFKGPVQEGDSAEQVSPVLQLDEVLAKETELSAQVFKSMMGSRSPIDMAIYLGWMCACWLKPMLQSGTYQDFFPLLHIHGTPGSGKTESSKTMSIFGGNDGLNGSIGSASSGTAFFVRAEISSTTSVPRLVDEFVKHKIAHAKYQEVFDSLKLAGTKGSLGRGKITKDSGTNSSATTEVKVMSSPVVYMGTLRTEEEELLQRSLVLELRQSDIQDQELGYGKNYDFVCSHKEELIPYAKMLMLSTLKITPEKLKSYWDATEWAKTSVTDARRSKGLRCAQVGLLFARDAFAAYGCSEETLAIVDSLVPRIEEYRNHPAYKFLYDVQYSEADRAVQRMFDLVMVHDPAKNEKILKEGIHYTFDTTGINLMVLSAWFPLFSYYKQMGYPIEFTTHKAFINALSKESYYVGTGIARGVNNSDEWHTLSIQGLLEKGIKTTMFGN